MFERSIPRSFWHVAAAILMSLGTAACAPTAGSLLPHEKPAADWQARLPHNGQFKELLDWWDMFDDEGLKSLLAIAERENASLAAAAANIRQARANYESQKSNLLPTLDAATSVTRSGTNAKETQKVAASTTRSGALDAAWEVDLFGKARNNAKAADARTASSTADWHDARVSLSAEVADYYVQYRACRLLVATYRQELASQRETIKATEMSASSGLKSTADLALVRASAASSSQSMTAQEADCELIVKSLTEITGGDEGRVRDLLKKGRKGIPAPQRFKMAVPADLLRQRPDLRSLEWDVVAEAYELGASKADLYPSLSLAGSITFNANNVSGKSIPWSFGPSLSLPVFDGGLRRAAVRSARAELDSATANYRAGILAAVGEVEAALVRLDSSSRQLRDATIAAREYNTYFKSVDENWRAGGASVLDREEARRSAQSAELSVIELRRDTVRYWIALYKALGGGWTSASAEDKNQGNIQ
jgi:multidrug efflux system outer membrane protein